jgi:hypothetical protein
MHDDGFKLVDQLVFQIVAQLILNKAHQESSEAAKECGLAACFLS